LFQGIGKGARQVVFMYLSTEVNLVFGIIETVNASSKRFHIIESADRPPLVRQVGTYQERARRNGGVEVFDVTDIEDTEGKW
jgi:hypothetical protein